MVGFFCGGRGVLFQFPSYHILQMLSFKTKKPIERTLRFFLSSLMLVCGGRGIRTPGGVTLNSFQDCRIRPLCHSSFKILRACPLKPLRRRVQIYKAFLNLYTTVGPNAKKNRCSERSDFYIAKKEFNRFQTRHLRI